VSIRRAGTLKTTKTIGMYSKKPNRYKKTVLKSDKKKSKKKGKHGIKTN